MAESRWQDIYLHLKSGGFLVYAPGSKTGEAVTEYLVVKQDGSTRHSSGISTDVDLYSILCYVPEGKYSTLEPLLQRVKLRMKSLEPMILPYGSQTPSYFDDVVNGHMVSIMYKNYKKMY